jgi:hypothetical protein
MFFMHLRLGKRICDGYLVVEIFMTNAIFIFIHFHYRQCEQDVDIRYGLMYFGLESPFRLFKKGRLDSFTSLYANVNHADL